MAEQKLFFDDIKEGDTGPEFSHELTRTDLVMYAGAARRRSATWPSPRSRPAADGAGGPALRPAGARPRDAAVLGRRPGRHAPHPPLRRLRPLPLLPTAVLPGVLEQQRRVGRGERR